MTKNNQTFTIDDTLGTSDNLAAYAQVLEAMDALLGETLSSKLAVLATGQAVDTAVIWDALYATIAAVEPGNASSRDGTGSAEGAA